MKGVATSRSISNCVCIAVVFVHVSFATTVVGK